jgi:hypothetical protein
MWMAVEARWSAMGGPAGVGNAGVRIKDFLEIDVGLVDELPQLGHLSNLLEGKNLVLLVSINGKPGRVVATVL